MINFLLFIFGFKNTNSPPVYNYSEVIRITYSLLFDMQFLKGGKCTTPLQTSTCVNIASTLYIWLVRTNTVLRSRKAHKAKAHPSQVLWRSVCNATANTRVDAGDDARALVLADICMKIGCLASVITTIS